jgi:hypothetical protein
VTARAGGATSDHGPIPDLGHGQDLGPGHTPSPSHAGEVTHLPGHTAMQLKTPVVHATWADSDHSIQAASWRETTLQ